MNKKQTYESSKFWEELRSGQFASMIKETAKGNKLSNAQEVYNTMKPIFAQHPDIEKVFCIFLNGQNKILAIEELFSGSITSSHVYPRELLKIVLEKQAASVILVHNHPSGEITPSSEDFKITAKVNMALASIDVKLYDHLIVGDTWYSFADNGWIEKASIQYWEFINSSKHIR